jgi:hypothetical protein
LYLSLSNQYYIIWWILHFPNFDVLYFFKKNCDTLALSSMIRSKLYSCFEQFQYLFRRKYNKSGLFAVLRLSGVFPNYCTSQVKV